jgi:hypothetical protein
MGIHNADCVCTGDGERYEPDDNGSGVFKAIAETPLETKEQIPATNYIQEKRKVVYLHLDERQSSFDGAGAGQPIDFILVLPPRKNIQGVWP